MLRDLMKETVYCPICSTGREKPKLKLPIARTSLISISWGLLLGSLFGILLNFNFWTGGILGVLSAVLCFLGLEVYYSVKFKGELECPVCHFDPLLFRKSPEAAKQKCLEGLQRKEPAFIARWRALQRQQLEGS